MRIRQANDYRTAPPRPMPWDSAAAILGAAGLLCELNRSSWIDSINLSLSNHRQEAKLEGVNEELLNVYKSGVEADEEEEEDIVEKVEDRKGLVGKRREQETEPSGSGAMNKCKKTDGKGWHCKRLAQSPHSLCTYHLTQLRSYRARFEDHVSSDQRKKSSSAVDYGGAASNYYYYYSIPGPWRGKRRGPVIETSEWNVDRSGKSVDNDNGGGGDDDVEEGEESRNEVTYKKKKKRVIKRRGRKPVKARSLKSLL